MSTPVEEAGRLVVGTVSSVSPNEIKAILDHDAPQATALNTGTPTAFPRINGYVLIPNETGAVVGIVGWIGIEYSTVPKRTEQKDFNLVDLPFAIRKMSLTPIGTLVMKKGQIGDQYVYRLERGVFVFPSVGDPIQLPTVVQLRSIVESEGVDRRVAIGVAPLAANAVVSVDPDKLFGRHLAVLGNTGSGKSCTLAGLIRWSLVQASTERGLSGKTKTPNARFIVLDPNGEYTEAFKDLGCRIFKVPPFTAPSEVKQLVVPAWMWNSHEWSVFAMAAPGAQRPLLLQALRELRAGKAISEPVTSRANRRFMAYKAHLERRIVDHTFAGFPNNSNLGISLVNIATDATTYVGETTGDISTALSALADNAASIATSRRWKSTGREGYNDFSETDVKNVIAAINKVLEHVPVSQTHASSPSEDAPAQFNVTQLPDHIEHLAGESGAGQMASFIATLAMRIRLMLADRRLGPLVAPDVHPTLAAWLENHVGGNDAVNGPIAVLDLSLVPSDVLHITIAVISRLIFEAVQRHRKLMGQELPTVLVLEEAHNFVQRSRSAEDGLLSPTALCRHVFERIAREGRKFGLGLVLSSQRPDELSPTVLGQCNTFILHRIVNDQDQELVSRLVPDNLGSLLRELPNLPSRQAILLGWATPVPILVEVKELPKEHRPQSSDPRFWDTWVGARASPIDWKAVCDDWVL